MSNYLVIFNGVDASGGPAAVTGLTAVHAGHRIVNVIGLNITGDQTSGFSTLAVADGEIIQDNGQNWSSYSFIALMERP
jgi:hypothetical protein